MLIKSQQRTIAKSLSIISLQINGLYISWQHLVTLYERNKGHDITTPRLNMLHKITKEHIYLMSYSKMKVNLAVQVC